MGSLGTAPGCGSGGPSVWACSEAAAVVVAGAVAGAGAGAIEGEVCVGGGAVIGATPSGFAAVVAGVGGGGLVADIAVIEGFRFSSVSKRWIVGTKGSGVGVEWEWDDKRREHDEPPTSLANSGGCRQTHPPLNLTIVVNFDYARKRALCTC